MSIVKIKPADVVEADECERAYAKGWEYGERAAESRRKRGEWVDMIVENGTHWKVCSICHAPSPRNGRDNFCPNCGADMRGEAMDDELIAELRQYNNDGTEELRRQAADALEELQSKNSELLNDFENYSEYCKAKIEELSEQLENETEYATAPTMEVE